MTCEQIDTADWPATYSQGPGWYSLRIETDHGVEEHIVRDPRERVGPREVAELREMAVALHSGARCEEAA